MTASARTPPGPPGFLSAFRALRRDPLQFLLDVNHEYGDVVLVRLGTKRVYLAAHPDDVRHVLQENHRNYGKGKLYRRGLRPLLGNGLLTADGDAWRRQRRLEQPVFSRKRVAPLVDTMIHTTDAMLARWKVAADRGEPLDVAAESIDVTLRILLEAVFGRTDAATIDAFCRALLTVEQRINPVGIVSPIPMTVPITRGNIRFRQALGTLDGFVLRLIEEHRAAGEDSGDFLSMLLAARDEETGEGMSAIQVRDEVMTILQAGHEPPSDAISWSWFLLARHPEVQARLESEIDEVLGGRPPTVEDLSQLTYTTMVFHEAMRLYPPGWVFGREAIEADEVGGYPVGAGSLVAVSPYVTHRHPAFWDDPDRFDPERFSPERLDGMPRFAYFPFGGGPRLCMGETYGTMMALVVIAMVSQAFRLDPVPGRKTTPQPLISLVPDHIWVTARPRQPAPA